MMKITLCQKNFILGDIQYNQDLVLDTIQRFKHSDLIVFPELFLTGYPPEDLLMRQGLYRKLSDSLENILASLDQQTVLLGTPRQSDGLLFNSCAIISKSSGIEYYDKQYLPNYSVFDEKRYFERGTSQKNVITIKGKRCFIAICKDTWFPETFKAAKKAKADHIVSINASPYFHGKREKRIAHFKSLQENYYQIPLIYLNCVGGQDELVFDGNSFILDKNGECIFTMPAFEESTLCYDLDNHTHQHDYKPLCREAEIFSGLVLSVRDYFHKNHFKTALIGLSGGIDSALTACIASKALGPENVYAVAMPSQFSADISLSDAKALADNLNIQLDQIPIHSLYECFLSNLAPHFMQKPFDTTEENLQARIRGILLMALANKHHRLVLTTSNKSELAVGYSTLYGDSAGAFCVLKDIYKTEVYHLANWLNRDRTIIPQRIITRAPSAELHPDQTDQDHLPPYEILDPIIEDFIEKNMDISELKEKYLQKDLIEKVVRLIKRNEYKRRQSAPGPKITERAFGRDWRYPISENYNYQ